MAKGRKKVKKPYDGILAELQHSELAIFNNTGAANFFSNMEKQGAPFNVAKLNNQKGHVLVKKKGRKVKKEREGKNHSSFYLF